MAGAEIRSAYPIAPVMPHCPLSIALYGYSDHLYVGLDADGTAISELDSICEMLEEALSELTSLPKPRAGRVARRAASQSRAKSGRPGLNPRAGTG